MCGFRICASVAVWACLYPGYSQERFQEQLNGYVPEGRPHRLSSTGDIEQCEAACAHDSSCKAFAFKTTTPSCFLYDRVYASGSKMNRKLGMRSSGLTIVPKRGYVSAFKSSSFPPPPVWKR